MVVNSTRGWRAVLTKKEDWAYRGVSGRSSLYRRQTEKTGA